MYINVCTQQSIKLCTKLMGPEAYYIACFIKCFFILAHFDTAKK